MIQSKKDTRNIKYVIVRYVNDVETEETTEFLLDWNMIEELGCDISWTKDISSATMYDSSYQANNGREYIEKNHGIVCHVKEVFVQQTERYVYKHRNKYYVRIVEYFDGDEYDRYYYSDSYEKLLYSYIKPIKVDTYAFKSLTIYSGQEVIEHIENDSITDTNKAIKDFIDRISSSKK